MPAVRNHISIPLVASVSSVRSSDSTSIFTFGLRKSYAVFFEIIYGLVSLDGVLLEAPIKSRLPCRVARISDRTSGVASACASTYRPSISGYKSTTRKPDLPILLVSKIVSRQSCWSHACMSVETVIMQTMILPPEEE